MGFTDMIKLKILKWEDYPGLCRCAQSNLEREAGGVSQRRKLCDVGSSDWNVDRRVYELRNIGDY